MTRNIVLRVEPQIGGPSSRHGLNTVKKPGDPVPFDEAVPGSSRELTLNNEIFQVDGVNDCVSG